MPDKDDNIHDVGATILKFPDRPRLRHVKLPHNIARRFEFSTFPVTVYMVCNNSENCKGVLSLHIIQVDLRDWAADYLLVDPVEFNIVKHGPYTAFCRIFPERPLLVGRSKASHFVVPSEFVSHQHFSLAWDGKYFTFINSSKNGTCIEYTGGREII